MQVKAKSYCAGRTRDGRMFVLMEGAVTAFNDSDADMIDLVKSWLAAGTAEDVTPTAESTEDDAPVAQPVKKAAVSRRTSTRETDK